MKDIWKGIAIVGVWAGVSWMIYAIPNTIMGWVTIPAAVATAVIATAGE